MPEQNEEINYLKAYVEKKRAELRRQRREDLLAVCKILGIFFLGLFGIRVLAEITIYILK